jgi:hypothetical protein
MWKYFCRVTYWAPLEMLSNINHTRRKVIKGETLELMFQQPMTTKGLMSGLQCTTCIGDKHSSGNVIVVPPLQPVGCLWERAGVNQQPPMHQFRMRPFKPFWGWTQTHPAHPAWAFLFSSSPAQGFFSPLICPKVFPSYLPPLP